MTLFLETRKKKTHKIQKQKTTHPRRPYISRGGLRTANDHRFVRRTAANVGFTADLGPHALSYAKKRGRAITGSDGRKRILRTIDCYPCFFFLQKKKTDLCSNKNVQCRPILEFNKSSRLMKRITD